MPLEAALAEVQRWRTQVSRIGAAAAKDPHNNPELLFEPRFNFQLGLQNIEYLRTCLSREQLFGTEEEKTYDYLLIDGALEEAAEAASSQNIRRVEESLQRAAQAMEAAGNPSRFARYLRELYFSAVPADHETAYQGDKALWFGLAHYWHAEEGAPVGRGTLDNPGGYGWPVLLALVAMALSLISTMNYAGMSWWGTWAAPLFCLGAIVALAVSVYFPYRFRAYALIYLVAALLGLVLVAYQVDAPNGSHPWVWACPVALLPLLKLFDVRRYSRTRRRARANGPWATLWLRCDAQGIFEARLNDSEEKPVWRHSSKNPRGAIREWVDVNTADDLILEAQSLAGAPDGGWVACYPALAVMTWSRDLSELMALRDLWESLAQDHPEISVAQYRHFFANPPELTWPPEEK